MTRLIGWFVKRSQNDVSCDPSTIPVIEAVMKKGCHGVVMGSYFWLLFSIMHDKLRHIAIDLEDQGNHAASRVT
jgi:hypothetical protein